MRTAPATTGLTILTISFLVVSVSIETAYSWRHGLADPFYLVKVGWALLAAGVLKRRDSNASLGLALLAGGWGWLAANFWRAVADRLVRIADGQALRLGSVELWFAGACLLVCLSGLAWSLILSARSTTR
jgi:hypothetical protein